MKSVITDNMDQCFICGSPYMIEVHHCIHGTANRKLADKYGLTVGLCHICHSKLHDHGTKDKVLQQLAQLKFEETYPDLDFMKIFGRSYK